ADIVNDIFEDSEGNIWIGAMGGVSKFVMPKFTGYTPEEHGIADNPVSLILEVSNGDLWFCADDEGVSRYDGSKFSLYTSQNGLVNDWVTTMFEDSDGNLWFGTRGGVSRKNSNNWEKFTVEKDGLIENIITTIFEDNSGNIWLGTLGSGVSKFTGNGFENYTPDEFDLPGGTITCIEQDNSGDIWFGTNEDGVSRFDGETFTKFNTSNELIDDWVKIIFKDSRGVLWFGTHGGVSRFDGTDFSDYTDQEGLIDNRIHAIYEDDEGIIWFATDGGLSQFNGTEFRNFTTGQGLSSNVCYFIVREKDYYYIGTNKGLNRFDGERFKIYTSKDGLGSNVLGVHLLDSHNNLWLGSGQSGFWNGVSMFDLSLDKSNDSAPPVHITRLRIFENDTTVVDGHRFNHDENYMKFDFVGLCFTSPEEVMYEYMLEGLDKDWIRTGERSVAYPYIPPGREYTFKVKAMNNDGLWGEIPAEISFTIKPPFWETNWFRGLAILIIGSSLFGYYRFRIERLKKLSIHLEKVVDERTLELKQAQAQLVQSEKLASIGNLAAGVAHEINNPIGTVKSAADTMSRAASKIKEFISNSASLEEVKQNEKLNKALEIINQNADTTSEASDRVTKIVQSLKSFSHLDEAEFQKADIHKGIESTLILLEHELKNKITVTKKFADLPEIYCYPNELNQVFINILLNAIQAIEDEGIITINTLMEDDIITIEISDTGTGIPHDEIQKLFEPKFSGKGSRIKAGMGLFNSYSIIKKHDGEIKVESELGKGTSVIILLPARELNPSE
ncbi:MAG: GHKL domain-containing protein, partial [bacterium]|nr:GHKL domain-containing protein [bacterium]